MNERRPEHSAEASYMHEKKQTAVRVMACLGDGRRLQRVEWPWKASWKRSYRARRKP